MLKRHMERLNNWSIKHFTYKKWHKERFSVINSLKLAKNVYFQSFLAIFTQHDPLKREKIGHTGRQHMERLNNWSIKHFTYKKLHKKKFPVIDSLKWARNVDFQWILVIFTQHDPLKEEKIGHIGRQNTWKA